ncbi:putative integral membrane protein [Chlamydia pneumoniae TW-183]|uniref:Probable metal transport system membrane protein CPn_0346/CP_0414/CPj0346/CpB0353 n=2 Tax=Chlamydia pneumoniae TaxID=83558 RepID=Y346_CHLPN|nr:metal ABC transporter permease [Chlamydia pneumoniae]Q9Z8J7.1 RecName: Full=Probable metal transport system membrane protein CPn_0346/CP_0414/CPj0346/CpB0353 [Chlamydia pneumoniae]AAD18490.1 Integral Membrane Protein [Chlamydia pneumoniae CWL029]AAF38258.1 ABC transporter, permease protein, putative [Chlamydia pneumoniae AR39]AAP98284.1 putative integral membrane protein [Chlamydia pneumoniae TW-183]CRI32845.1 Probable metal transport system membrane protein CPn_0346/CP_0414/CPj0346/CpB0353
MALGPSPYYGVSFFQFFSVFFSRLFSGSLFTGSLYIDDIQIIVFLAISCSGAFAGTFLVLRKMAMYANAVSHTVLFGLVCVCLFTHQLTTLSLGTLTLAAMATAMLTGFLIYFIRNTFKVSEESSTALVFSLLFSLSLVLLVFMTKNAHIGTELVLGNADSLTKEDIFPVTIVILANAVITIFAFRSLVCSSFDSVFASSLGIPIRLVDYLIIFQLSACLVGAFKAVGVLMALAFLIIPSLIAKVIAKSIRSLMAWSLVFSIGTAFLAPASSRAILSAYDLGLSTSGISVVFLTMMYIVVKFISYFRGYFSKNFEKISEKSSQY